MQEQTPIAQALKIVRTIFNDTITSENRELSNKNIRCAVLNEVRLALTELLKCMDIYILI